MDEPRKLMKQFCFHIPRFYLPVETFVNLVMNNTLYEQHHMNSVEPICSIMFIREDEENKGIRHLPERIEYIERGPTLTNIWISRRTTQAPEVDCSQNPYELVWDDNVWGRGKGGGGVTRVDTGCDDNID